LRGLNLKQGAKWGKYRENLEEFIDTIFSNWLWPPRRDAIQAMASKSINDLDLEKSDITMLTSKSLSNIRL
jgi:hypothetical protein